MDIANCSLLDESSSCVEALNLGVKNNNKMVLIDKNMFENNLQCLISRLQQINNTYQLVDVEELDQNIIDQASTLFIQTPNKYGKVINSSVISNLDSKKITKVIISDIQNLFIQSIKDFDPQIVVGGTQRLGIPMWFGGPYAGYIACQTSYLRKMPGRLVGQSVDVLGKKSFRLAIQTREQHIKREKSTSNICTAQALLANMTAMYCVFHGKQNLIQISQRINNLTQILYNTLKQNNIELLDTQDYFDTISISNGEQIFEKLKNNNILAYLHEDKTVSISLNSTTTINDVYEICKIILDNNITLQEQFKIKERTDDFLSQDIFQKAKSETEMMRYIQKLGERDISLTNSMIPLGSCTMKLNSSYTLALLCNEKVMNIHPYYAFEQLGFIQIINELEEMLKNLLGFEAVNFQPNSGAQGEYTGLQCIKEYHKSNNQQHRNVIILPVSAHGTNASTASLHDLKIVQVKLVNGQTDMDQFRLEVEKHKDNLFGMMITYPSTCGIFESSIKEIIDLIHINGGLIYMDGANMNAMTGFVQPGQLGFDVCHLNLHKTFSIPHGGGGPGVGPIGVNKKLVPFIPKHKWLNKNTNKDYHFQISTGPYGSASILTISYIYLKMLGSQGVKKATFTAILNANYIRSRLQSHYQIKYTGDKGMCAHEFILDLSEFLQYQIRDSDFSKRLMDYGFHSPTVSFPSIHSLMIEPTESESKEELDRFCDSLIQIRKEVQEIIDGKYTTNNNLLVNAPHSQDMLLNWNYPYSIEKAFYPLSFIMERNKFFPRISRNQDAQGDKKYIGKIQE